MVIFLSGLDYFKNKVKEHFCYYRSQMSKSEQKVYDKIREGFLLYKNNISVQGMSVEQIQRIYNKLVQDNPCIFFVDRISYQHIDGIKFGKVIPHYRLSKEKANEILLNILRKYRPLVDNYKNSSDIDKEEFVHNYLCRHVNYDNDCFDSSFECVGPLLYGKGVCEGISKASKLLFDMLEVKSLVVHGKSLHQQTGTRGNSHAWIIVNIDNKFYHLDITFDLTIQSFGIIRFDYFNLSDKEIMRDHTTQFEVIPKCIVSGEYYKKKNMYMHTKKDYKEYLNWCIRQGQKDIVFKLPIRNNIEEIKQKILAITQESYTELLLYNIQYQLMYNETQYVFHLHIM